MKLPINEEFAGAMNGAGESAATTPCEAVWDLLSLYADKEANGEETAMVETHIAVCADCARDLAFMQETSLSFSTLLEVEPPAELREAILASTVDRPNLGRRIAELIHSLLAPAPARYGFAAAAGLAGILVAVGIHRGLPTVDGVAPNPAEYQPKIAGNAPIITPSLKDPVAQPAPLAVKSREATVVSASADARTRAARSVGSHSRRRGSVASFAAVTSVGSNAPLTPGPAPRTGIAGGEMKIKPPSVDRQPEPEDNTIRTADMVVMGDPSPMGQPAVPEAIKKSAPEPEPAAPAPPLRTRFTLTSTSSAETVGQAASLAELKRSLRQRDAESARAIEQSLKARQIRLPVLTKTF